MGLRAGPEGKPWNVPSVPESQHLMKKKPSRGRPRLPNGEHRIWRAFRLTPNADRQLRFLAIARGKSAGLIVSQLIESAFCGEPLNK